MFLVKFRNLPYPAIEWTGFNEDEMREFCSDSGGPDLNGNYEFEDFYGEGRHKIEQGEYIVNFQGRLLPMTITQFYQFFEDYFENEYQLNFMHQTPDMIRYCELSNDNFDVQQELTNSIKISTTNEIDSEDEKLKELYIHLGEYLRDKGYLKIKENNETKQLESILHVTQIQDWERNDIKDASAAKI